jgi:hypothetical protein
VDVILQSEKVIAREDLEERVDWWLEVGGDE